MANITTVNLNSGVPNGPAGAATVSTLDNLIGVSGTPIASVLSVQGITGMIPVKVDGSGVTQPVSGTVALSGTSTISGTVTANQGAPPWMVRINDGTNSAAIKAASTAAVAADPALVVAVSPNNSVAVTGTFWQATQPVSGTVTVTQATAANLNATVTGTITANQGGTWNITNVSGTVSLPTGAATSANQPTAATLGSTTSGQTGNLDLGAVTTSAPTYTTGQSNALSLNTSGGLRVDGSGVTQPVSGTFWQATQPISGTIAATQSGTWTTRIVGNTGAVLDASSAQNQVTPAGMLLVGAEFNTTPTTITSGNSSPLQLDSAGNLLVNIKAGAGSGGTASNFGSAFPATGTAAGAEYLTTAPTLTNGQMVALQTNISGSLKVDGSAVTQPVSGTFWQATQPVSGTVTVTQATAANLNATVTGTITANQGGTWTVQPGNTANTTAWLVTGTGGTFPVTGTFWQATQPISAASLPLPTGAATSANQPSAAAMGSTTAGQTGNLALGAVTTASPAYTTGQSNALSLDTSGCLRSNSTIPIMLTGPTWNSATALNTTTPVISNNNVGTGSICGQISTTTTITGGALTFEESYDNAISWKSIPTSRLIDPITNANLANPYTLAPSTNQAFLVVDSGVTQVRVRLSTVIAGTGTCIIYTTTSPISNLVQVAAGAPIPVTGTFWQATQPVSGTVTVQQATAANLNATVSGTVTANQGGTWTVQPGNTANTTAWLVTGTGGTFPVTGTFWQATQPVSGTFWQATQPVSIAATVAVAGDTANAASDAGNPVKIGGLAKTTNPTAVADGQRVNALFDKVGKMVAVGAIRQLKGVQTTTITATTETTIVTAGAAGVFQDLYGLILANTSATAVNVAIKDATAGTTRVTIQVPAGDTRGFTVPVDSAVVQATAANNWTATLSAAVTSILVTALYVSNI